MITIIVLAALTAAAGVGLGILFNKYVINDFPEAERKTGKVKTIVVFLLLFIVIFAALYGKVIADASVKSFSAQIEQDIKKNYSNLDIVKNGIDVATAGKDPAKLNSTVNDLTRIIKPGEWGVPNFIWNTVLGYARKELQKVIIRFNEAGGENSPFVNEKNYLTVSSFINGIQVTALKIIKNVVIVIISVCVILLAVYILSSLSKASKERKRAGNK